MDYRTTAIRLVSTTLVYQGSPVIALFPDNLYNWYGLPAQGVAIDNWADDNFDHSELNFIEAQTFGCIPIENQSVLLK